MVYSAAKVLWCWKTTRFLKNNILQQKEAGASLLLFILKYSVT